MKFGAYICIQSGVIDIFPNSKVAAAAILDLFGWATDHSRCLIHGAYLLWKFCHDRLSTFQVIRIWFFFSFRLRSPIHAPKISVFGGFYPQNLGTDHSDPQKALPWAEWRVLSPYWPRSDLRCDPWPFLRNQKKKKRHPQTVPNWLFAQTTHVAVSKSKFACQVASGV